MSRIVLCKSPTDWSTVVLSKFAVIDERNGVTCSSTNISHRVESHVGISAFAFVVSVAFFLLIGLLFVGSFFQGITDCISAGFEVLLCPASRKIIRWLGLSRANSCVRSHLEILACISSNSDDPFHKQISSFRESMERNLYPVFDVNLLFILWNTPILSLTAYRDPH